MSITLPSMIPTAFDASTTAALVKLSCGSCGGSRGYKPSIEEEYTPRYEIVCQSNQFFHQPRPEGEEGHEEGTWGYRRHHALGRKADSWDQFKVDFQALKETNEAEGCETLLSIGFRHQKATSNEDAENSPHDSIGLGYLGTVIDAPLSEYGLQCNEELAKIIRENVKEGMPLPDPRMVFSSPQPRALQTAQGSLKGVYNGELRVNITRDFGEGKTSNPCDLQSSLTVLKNKYGDFISAIVSMEETDTRWRCFDCLNKHALTLTTGRDPHSEKMVPVLQEMGYLQDGTTEIAPKEYRRETAASLEARTRRGAEQSVDHFEAVKEVDPSIPPAIFWVGHSTQLGALSRGTLNKFTDVPNTKNWSQMENGEMRFEVFKYRPISTGSASGETATAKSMWPDNLSLQSTAVTVGA